MKRIIRLDMTKTFHWMLLLLFLHLLDSISLFSSRFDSICALCRFFVYLFWIYELKEIEMRAQIGGPNSRKASNELNDFGRFQLSSLFL